jgi:hypothetical protein
LKRDPSSQAASLNFQIVVGKLDGGGGLAGLSDRRNDSVANIDFCIVLDVCYDLPGFLHQELPEPEAPAAAAAAAPEFVATAPLPIVPYRRTPANTAAPSHDVGFVRPLGPLASDILQAASCPNTTPATTQNRARRRRLAKMSDRYFALAAQPCMSLSAEAAALNCGRHHVTDDTVLLASLTYVASRVLWSSFCSWLLVQIQQKHARALAAYISISWDETPTSLNLSGWIPLTPESSKQSQVLLCTVPTRATASIKNHFEGALGWVTRGLIRSRAECFRIPPDRCLK